MIFHEVKEMKSVLENFMEGSTYGRNAAPTASVGVDRRVTGGEPYKEWYFDTSPS